METWTAAAAAEAQRGGPEGAWLSAVQLCGESEPLAECISPVHIKLYQGPHRTKGVVQAVWVRLLRDHTFTAMLVEALTPLEFRTHCGPWLHVLDGLLRMVPATQVCCLPDTAA